MAKKTARKINQNDADTAAKSMLLLQVTMGRLGTTRKGDMSEVTTEADKELLRLSKRLLDCDEYTAIRRTDGEMLKWIRSRTLPALFRSGLYNIRPIAAPDVDEYLRGMRDVRSDQVAALKAVYKVRREEDKKRLGPQFNANDYPPVEELDDHFSLSWRFFAMGPPQDLETISPEIFKRERESLANLFEETKRESTLLLRAGFKEMIDHMIERLTPNGDGKRKRFHAANVANLMEFIDTFKLRDLADDKELQVLLDKTKTVLSGVNLLVLRNSETTRDVMLNSFEKISDGLDAITEDAPTRKLDPKAF